ncbi:MAG: hypothetical protein R8F63_14900 [Acidimicrobiales bacterium]|nr:hypothetical protein [Acidimicrobiales bacterium]
MGDLDDQLRHLAERRADRTPVTRAADAMSAPARRAPRWGYAAVAAALVAIAGIGFAAFGDDGPDVRADDRNDEVAMLQHLTISSLGVELDVPASWVPSVGEDTFQAEGDDGYVELELRPPSGDATFDAVTVDGETGRRRVDAAGNVTIEVDRPNLTTRDVLHFPLWITGTPAHIDAIVESIRWLPPEEPAQAETTTVDAVDFGVRIEIPAHWEPIEDGRTWGGDDGWVAVDVLPSTDVGPFLDSLGVTEDEVDIGDTTVLGSTATLVTTRDAIELEFGTFAVSGAIVPTPAPVLQHDEAWDQIVIGGDADHLADILASAEWIGSTGPTPPPTDGERLDVEAPDPAATYDLVAGTSEGVEFRDLHSNRVDRMLVGPTQLAFYVGGYVVHEADDESHSAPPITVWHEAGSYVIDLGDGFRQTQLRDVALVDGVAKALVTKQTGATIEDWVDDLLIVDLATGDVERLTAAGSWEVGASAVRFADGAIAMAMGLGGETWIEVIDHDGDPLWRTEPSIEEPGLLWTRGDIATAYDARVTPTGERSIELVSYDLQTGDEVVRTLRQLSVEPGTDLADGWCRRAVAYQDIACQQSGGPPIYVALDLGLIHPGPEPGLTEGAPTTVDREVSATFPDRHPCGLGGGSGPGDVLSSTEIALDNGLTMTVWVWTDWRAADDVRVMMQGNLPDWRSPAIEIGRFTDVTQPVTVTPLEADSPFADRGVLSIFVPDEISTAQTPTGFSAIVDFDGCELVVTSSGIVN